jgi:hypothetical protein
LHADPDSSKFITFAPQRGGKIRGALPHDGGDRPGVDGELELSAADIRHPYAFRQWARKVTAHGGPQRFVPAPAGVPAGDGGIGGKNSGKRLRGARHGDEPRVRRGGRATWRRCT